jgi:hypothetical protein
LSLYTFCPSLLSLPSTPFLLCPSPGLFPSMLHIVSLLHSKPLCILFFFRPCSEHSPPTLSVWTIIHLTSTPPHTQPMFMSIFCSPCISTLEDGGSTVLWNIGIQSPHYMVQQPRKPYVLFPLLCKPQISHSWKMILTSDHSILSHNPVSVVNVHDLDPRQTPEWETLQKGWVYPTACVS